ncbi:MAG TPA: hypothetical protein VMG38_21865 [Trebonia sp.]|nr:hypothetical protein [Trebonia sp.]
MPANPPSRSPSPRPGPASAGPPGAPPGATGVTPGVTATGGDGGRPGDTGDARPDAGHLSLTDYCLAIAAGLTVALVTNIHYLLSQPYWLDEAWVADSLRAPLGLVPRLSSSTPLAWTLTLRLVPLGGPQRARLVPLAFYGLAVATGYLLGRELRLTRFTTGLLTAGAVLLSPAMLARGDLKQYTAEAFSAVLVWLLVARLENDWNRRRLAALALVTSVGCLLASTVVLTGCAALGCLGLECLVRGRRRRLAELTVATVAAVATFGVIYALVLKPRINPALAYYWRPNYLPGNEHGALSFLRVELHGLLGYLAFVHQAGAGSVTVVAVLALWGAVALAMAGRLALAALLPVTLIAVIVASAARIYPFGDERTSTFWLVMVPVLMAIGIAAVIGWATGRIPRSGRVPGWLGGAAALAATAVLLGAWGQANSAWIGRPAATINTQNPYAQVSYVEAHWRPGDVILVNEEASYGFAFYYRTPASAYPAVANSANGFVPQYPSTPWIIVATDRDAPSITSVVAEAEDLIAAEPAGHRGRIWVIRDHVAREEAGFWHNALAGSGLITIRMAKLNGRLQEPLLLVKPTLHTASSALPGSTGNRWQPMLSVNQ